MPGPWSPSSTRDFMSCPRLWLNKRQGLEERARVWNPALLAGTVFHAGMKHDIEGTEWDCMELLKAGWPPEEEGLEKACNAVLRGIELARQEALWHDGMIVALEDCLGGDPEEAARHGRYPGTADLVTEDKQGLMVTDYKTHWSRDARYADADLRETQRSWQLKQYAWFAQEKYQKPVTRVRKLLVYFTPVLRVWLVEYPVWDLAPWHAQAQEVWYQMDCLAGYGPHKPPVAWQHEESCERYGWVHRCSFYDSCWP